MTKSFVAVLAAAGILACATSAPAHAGALAPPVYPGAASHARPAGIADKAPRQTKAYSTSDGFAKVQAWYRARLKDAVELPEPGHEKMQDAFLVGQQPNGMIVLIKSFQGKTWILIGPPV